MPVCVVRESESFSWSKATAAVTIANFLDKSTTGDPKRAVTEKEHYKLVVGRIVWLLNNFDSSSPSDEILVIVFPGANVVPDSGSLIYGNSYFFQPSKVLRGQVQSSQPGMSHPLLTTTKLIL